MLLLPRLIRRHILKILFHNRGLLPGDFVLLNPLRRFLLVTLNDLLRLLPAIALHGVRFDELAGNKFAICVCLRRGLFCFHGERDRFTFRSRATGPLARSAATIALLAVGVAGLKLALSPLSTLLAPVGLLWVRAIRGKCTIAALLPGLLPLAGLLARLLT